MTGVDTKAELRTKKKILFYSAVFDDAMDRRIDKIIRDFPPDETELVFLHLSSLSGERGKKTIHENLMIKDISEYPVRNLKIILDTERPSAIITITFMHIIDRVFIALGKRLGIPVFFFQHGNITIDLPDLSIKKNSGKRAAYAKYFRYIMVYLRSLFPYLDPEKIGFLLRLVSNPKRYIQFYSPCRDFDSVRAVVFGNNYAGFLVSLGFRQENILNIGTPKADSGINELDLAGDRHILYLSGGCIIGNLYGWTVEKEHKLLGILADSGRELNVPVIYRPHPLQSEQETEAIARDLDVIVSKKDEIEYLVSHSLVVAGEASAALNEAIYQFKPILLFKENDAIRYRFDYADYGTGQPCSFETLGDLLNDPSKISVDREKYSSFIDGFITRYNPAYSTDAYGLICRHTG